MFAAASRHLKLLALPVVLALIVLIAGSATTLLYYNTLQDREQAALQEAFAATAYRASALVQREIGIYQTVMRGLRGFFEGSDEVSYEDFIRYTGALELSEELPGMRGIVWVELLPREELEAHQQRQREQLPVPYTVHPDIQGSLLAPITFIHPLDEANQRALGFDILANERAAVAALAARDRGELVISEPITLVQDVGSPSTAFVMYLPVYGSEAAPATLEARRQSLQGWVDVPFRVTDFMAGLAGELDPTVQLQLYDGRPSGSEPGQRIYSSDSGQAAAAGGDALSREYALTVGTRPWTLVVNATEDFRGSTSIPSRSRLVMYSGFALSLAVALLVLVIARSRDRSTRRALRLEDLYHALSEVNQAIVRMEDEAELLPLVCRMAVEFGGMSMAWVGRVDGETGQVEAVASFGEGEQYLQGLDLSIREGQASGRGPSGTALRENRPVIVNDYLNDAMTLPWQERVRHAGWKSAAAFPIQRGGKPFAALNVYHHKVGAFDEPAIRLLQEMSSDISFALDNFDRNAERAQFQADLRESEARLSTILENVGACIYLKNTEGRYLFANQQALDLWGVQHGGITGRTDEAFFDAATVQRIRENDRRVLKLGEKVELEETDTIKRTNTTRVFWSVKLPLRREDGSIYALCGISTDITDQKHDREQIHFLTHYDPLTGLPNKELLRERTRLSLEGALRSRRPLSLFCIDLDRFKNINDSLGLDIGDQVLQHLATRLTERLHLNATLCRSGGDEFFLLLPDVGTWEAESLAQDLLADIAQPLDVEDKRFAITASIGVACFPDHGRSFDELNQAADAALFQAKLAGRNTFALFAESMRAKATETLRLETELREAFAQGQLELHYQPQVDIRSERLLGLEALVRWRHPEYGYIPPSRFIPVAEDCGLITELDVWVLRAALSQQAAWRAEGLSVPTVAVNVSATQFYRADFCDVVEALLLEHDIPAHRLDLELTERIAMVHSGSTLATLDRLRQIGVKLSIDDFGTGYSSLGYLKRYPFDKLKIDKSFVDGVADDPEDQAIVMAIIGIARGLGFLTVAEGVETAEQLAFLRMQGCNTYQGYLHSRPQSAAALRPLLEQDSKQHG